MAAVMSPLSLSSRAHWKGRSYRVADGEFLLKQETPCSIASAGDLGLYIDSAQDLYHSTQLLYPNPRSTLLEVCEACHPVHVRRATAGQPELLVGSLASRAQARQGQPPDSLQA